jgi:hypothetical protein
MEEIRKQEQEVLEAQSLPLRSYLMQHVMPTLTAGLLEVCKVKPEDPVDYLAEYLFKVIISLLIPLRVTQLMFNKNVFQSQIFANEGPLLID